MNVSILYAFGGGRARSPAVKWHKSVEKERVMRRFYLDNIRWATVVLVVIYHVFFMYNAEGVAGGFGKITDLPVQYYDVFQYAVYPWFMAILFLVAGMSARFALDRYGDREFFKRRTRKLLIPTTVGLFVFQFLQGYVNMSLSDVFGAEIGDAPRIVQFLVMALSGIGVLWFIQTLWLFSVLLLLVRKIEKDRLWNKCGRANSAALVLLAAPIWLAAQVLNTPLIVVYRFGLYGALFFLGYFVFSHDRTTEVLKKNFPAFAAAAVLLGVWFCARCFGENFADKPVNRTPLYTSYCWFACLAILGGAAKYADFENGFTRWMNRRSYGLYVFHYLGISSVALWVAKPGLAPAPAVYALSLAAGFAAGYLLNAVISRAPFFRWAVLGLGKEEKNV